MNVNPSTEGPPLARGRGRRRPVRALMAGVLSAGLWALAVACGPAAEQPVPEEPQLGEPAPARTAPAPTVPAPPAAGEARGDLFVDRAAELGLEFEHHNGMSGELYFVEMTGAGGAFVDFDGDGDLDVYLVQGHDLGPGVTNTTFRDRLFRNDLKHDAAGLSEPHFTDVTEASGIEALGYGIGVATGDVDNDGDVDLYVTNWGANQLWLNDGDGTFTDASRRSGTDDTGWSTSAAFVDYDLDGWLDLYVANYVDYTYGNHKACFAPSSARDYCGPRSFEQSQDRLYHNRGDGTFESVSPAPGEPMPRGSGLGVVAADFDGDGWPDLYVANDQEENFLWHNRGDGSFENVALLSGAAVSLEGNAQASMGVDAADFDGDGDEDIFLTHLRADTNTLYLNDGAGNFTDATGSLGLGPPSWPFTAFGTAWLDFDGDGWLDLFAANGEVVMIPEQVEAGDPLPLRQPNQLFRNLEGHGFEDYTGRAGKVFELSEVSRGAAAGDVDDDGDPDLLVTNNDGAVRLLINESPPRRWLGVRAVGRDVPRDMLGARVVVELADGRRLWRRVRADASYASANDPRVLFALPGETPVSWVRVVWPGGAAEEWSGLELDRYHTLRQGSGRTVVRP